MSKPDSEPADSRRSLAREAQSRFFARDHVGVVRHFEGVGLERLINPIRSILDSRGAKFEDSEEQVLGRSVYTNIATFGSPNGPLTLWLTLTEVRSVGSVLDAKMFHQTEQSAEADEALAIMMDQVQQEVGKLG